MTKQVQAAATTARVAVFLAAQLREVAQTRIVQSFGAHARGQGPGPSEDDLKAFAKLVAQEHRLHKRHASPADAIATQPTVPVNTQPQVQREKSPSPSPATTARSQDGLSRVAYASLIDLTRMSFAGRSAPAECCDACSTVNLGSALICKGCNGKLPAYYTTHYGEPAQAQEHAQSCDANLHRSSVEDASSAPTMAARGASRSRTTRVIAPLASLALVLLASFVMLVGSMGGRVPDAARQVARTLTPLVEQPVSNSAVVSLVSASPLEAYGSSIPTELIDPQETIVEEGASTGRALDATSDSATPARRVRASLSSATPRPGIAPSTTPRAALRGQLARCESLNFFSRAICMNNSCSPQAVATSAECAPVVRQRRIDEARRNPVLMG